ncbi:unnamed protein product, partial [Vitis vinifera]|uniref:Uncharacterized protein n=1 Tax=Vitis vinifera TaxID=29760 RepID=D7UBT9_VITVI
MSNLRDNHQYSKNAKNLHLSSQTSLKSSGIISPSPINIFVPQTLKTSQCFIFIMPSFP